MAKELTLADLDKTLREHHEWVWSKLEEIERRLKSVEAHVEDVRTRIVRMRR